MKIYQFLSLAITFITKVYSLCDGNELNSKYQQYIVKVQSGEDQCAGVLIEKNMVLTTTNCFYQNKNKKSLSVFNQSKGKGGDLQSKYSPREIIGEKRLSKPGALAYHTPVLLKFKDEVESSEISYDGSLYENVSIEYFKSTRKEREYFSDEVRSYKLPQINRDFCEKHQQFNVRLDNYQVCTSIVYRESNLSNIHLGSPVFKTGSFSLVGLLTSVYDKTSNDTFYSTFVDTTKYIDEINEAKKQLAMK